MKLKQLLAVLAVLCVLIATPMTWQQQQAGLRIQINRTDHPCPDGMKSCPDGSCVPLSEDCMGCKTASGRTR
jgi:hypothetical protein